MRTRLVAACIVLAVAASAPLYVVAEYLSGKAFLLAAEGVREGLPPAERAGADEAFRQSRRLYDDVFRRALMLTFGAAMAAAVALAVGSGLLLSRAITRPLARLQEGVRRFGAGDFTHRVQVEGAKEFTELAAAMNGMARQVQEHQERLVHAERLAAWQRIARTLAHEMANPLTPMALAVQHLREAGAKTGGTPLARTVEQSTKSVLEEVERLQHLAREFSEFGRLPPPRLAPADLTEVSRGALALYGSGGGGVPSVEARWADEPLPVALDPEQFRQVLHNLLKNAREAAPDAKGIRAETRRRGAEALLLIEDQGDGMPPEALAGLFDPTFSTKGEGRGLGLAVVDKIVSDHGGRVRVESTPGRGTTFELAFPIRREPEAA